MLRSAGGICVRCKMMLITSGMDERDERKRTSGEASKRFRRHQNWSCTTAPGRVWRKPTYWPRGVRCIGGMTLEPVRGDRADTRRSVSNRPLWIEPNYR
jgi:hypothetical protein